MLAVKLRDHASDFNVRSLGPHNQTQEDVDNEGKLIEAAMGDSVAAADGLTAVPAISFYAIAHDGQAQ